MEKTATGFRARGAIATAGALCALVLMPATAAAQEAPICLEGGEKLNDSRDHFIGTPKRDSVLAMN